MPNLTRYPVGAITHLLTRGGCVALLLSVFLATPAGAIAPQVTLTAINQSGVEICYLFVAPDGSNGWGTDRLGSGATLAPGDSFAVRVTAGRYDVRVEDCDGNVLDEVRGADLSENRTWTITGDNPPAGTETPRAQPTAAEDKPEVTPSATAIPSVVLDQFLCCGKSVGGTNIWSIRYPTGWKVEYFGTPSEFFGAAFSNPEESITVTFLPSAMPEAGSVLDTGNVDTFLDGLVQVRSGEDAGFREFLRQPVPGVQDTRVWGGTWRGRSDKMWETYVVFVAPLAYVAPQVPHTYFMMMGVRAASSDWATGSKIYQDMLESAQIKSLKGSDAQQDAVGMGQPAVETGMVRFCPKECDWEWISASSPGGSCPVYGEESSPYEVPCEP
jgi:hypothetical protein